MSHTIKNNTLPAVAVTLSLAIKYCYHVIVSVRHIQAGFFTLPLAEIAQLGQLHATGCRPSSGRQYAGAMVRIRLTVLLRTPLLLPSAWLRHVITSIRHIPIIHCYVH